MRTKTDFDTLIAIRSHAMENARCPYDEEQLCAMVAQTVRRVEEERQIQANRRRYFRQVLTRYFAAACVALMLGCGTYIAVPQNELPAMRASMQIDRRNVPDTIANMLNPNISSIPNEKA